MGKYIPLEGPVPERHRKRIEHICRVHGVTFERMVEVIRARRKYRRANSWRKRSRRRQLDKNPNARRMKLLHGEAVYSGEGELHPLLRAVGLNITDFCRLAGIEAETFYRWYGHPLHPWPIELLRQYGWAKAMAEKLRELGVDPDGFKPSIPERKMPTGRYPRTSAQAPAFAPPEE